MNDSRVGTGIMIKYDSQRTLEGIAQVEKQLQDFIYSTEHLTSQFQHVFSELSGETIQQYEKVVRDYFQSAKLAETSIKTFIQLIHLVDTEIIEADRKSEKMFTNN
ncbi:hypothetical protein ACFSKI_02930 [Pseudogracilibacillus auburnensis]|uniref:Uncharacterized protein n=1 Tax=Pseudogracilibacillus auburnensis TaxID=1494959 RepID=A0A2V3W347_9BACI|nr:hypothetical protein [Pseudogracilibacillus auburnensis]MBO1005989.1 hypothetical protein [Pseudogracilibacillus auburnensis]PXW88136.1 hypothetical protein DFR56_104304 [Pseudogracilibacillus auburnensis]